MGKRKPGKKILNKARMLRIKKRRQRRMKRLFCIVFLLSACIFCAVQLKFVFTKYLKDAETADNIQLQTTDETKQTTTAEIRKNNSKWLKDLKLLSEHEPRAEEILKNLQLYPDEIIELYIKHNEAIDFVYNYPNLKNVQTNADSVDLSNDVPEAGIPLFFQWDTRWGYNFYGTGGMIAFDGCGPTCLSMVTVGLTKDLSWNPIKMAEFSFQNGYLDETNGTSWGLMSSGAGKLGLTSNEIPLEESSVKHALSEGYPIICSMRPGDFTTTGHFIVLYSYENGTILLNDPNSLTNSQRKWTYDELEHQIKNLWAFSI